jgi:hypothetical protein
VLDAEKSVLGQPSPYPNPLAASNIGVPGMVRQFQNQQDYQNYFNTISALQRQNMALGHEENLGKIMDTALKQEPIAPGGYGMLRQLFPGLPDASPQFAQNTNAAAQAAITEKVGRGWGPMLMGGAQPPGGVLPIPQVAGQSSAPVTVGAPAIVQAARENSAGRVAAAQAAAAAAHTPKHEVTLGRSGLPLETKDTTYPGYTQPSSTGAPTGLPALVRPAPGSQNTGGDNINVPGYSGPNELLGGMNPDAAIGGSAPLGAGSAAATPTTATTPPVTTTLPPATKTAPAKSVAAAQAAPTTAPTAPSTPTGPSSADLERALQEAHARDPRMYADMQNALNEKKAAAIEVQPNGDVKIRGQSGRLYLIYKKPR